MDAGAFSSDLVAEASQGLVLILVDCTKRGSNAELMQKYGVTGLPTLVITDPEGKKVNSLVGEQNDLTLMGTFDTARKKYSRNAPWQKSLAVALETGKKKSQPVILFVTQKSKPVSAQMEGFFVHSESMEAVAPFTLARMEYRKKDETLEKLKTRKAPMIYVLDPLAEDPLAEPIAKINRVKSPKKFKKELERALKKWKSAQEK